MFSSWTILDYSSDKHNDFIYVLYKRITRLYYKVIAGEECGDKVLKKYRSHLDCDYVQMAHHGQKGVREEFYKTESTGSWSRPLLLVFEMSHAGAEHCYAALVRLLD